VSEDAVPSRGAQATALLESLALKAAARHDADQLLATPEPATADNACWNFALFGNSDEGRDPTSTFTTRALTPGSPFKSTNPRDPMFGRIVPRANNAAARTARSRWHKEVASQVITEAGWRLQPDSPLKIAYQWQPQTAMYQHWELWYETPDTFVSVAKFPGKPVHAKTTETDLEAEGLQQVEIGVDPESISDLHLQRLSELDSDRAVAVPRTSVYPED
jgi:hypothetical protein